MKISIAMTTYNGALYLREQLDSILLQTLPPDEIIICDDGSTDETISIIEEYQQWNNIIFVKNEQQLGVILNFKKVVSMTIATNYVALSDQDDIWLPDKLSNLAAIMKHMDQDHPTLIHSDLILIDEENNVLNPSFKNEQGQGGYEENLQTLFFRNFVTGCTVLMNPALKRLFKDIPSNIYFHDEWLALLAFTFGKVNVSAKPTVRYRKHSNNVSIAAGTKPRNRYRAIFNQIIQSLFERNSFLKEQFITVGAFYSQYKIKIDPQKRLHFENFLKLQDQPYLVKKLAFRKVVRRFKID